MINSSCRTISLKSSSSSYHRKSLFNSSNNKINNKKKRPSTWTCHQRLSLGRHHTVSPRLTRWCSQHSKRRQRRSTKSSSGYHTEDDLLSQHYPCIDTKRQTIATISTNTNSDTATLNHHTITTAATTINHHRYHHYPPASVFHTQSLLFLFGFLFFPCWWVGGYYIKVAQESKDPMDIEEKKMMTVHPSLLANGKTSSRLFWVPPPLPPPSTKTIILNQDTIIFFYKWNRFMSLISVGLTFCIIGLLIWYCVKYK
jgi:hypothetical protein